LHKYIQEEIEFLNISSLNTTYCMSSRLRKSLNRRSETLDLQIQSRERFPQTKEQRTKPRRGGPRQPTKAARKEQHHEAKRGHRKMV